MHEARFLHKFISNALRKMHKSRLNALLIVVSSLLDNSKLTLTSLGKNIKGTAKVKNKIKLVDRLLSNKNLLADKFYIYKSLTFGILNNIEQAVILVDWSGCCSEKRWILQASLATSGRSIPLYKEIHPIRLLSNSKIESSFLKKLKLMFPEHLKVIIVTDGGFKTPWFKSVKAIGWDYVGRIRGKFNMKIDSYGWVLPSSFNDYKKGTPKSLGYGLLGKEVKFLSNLFIYKSKCKSKKYYTSKFLKIGSNKRVKYSSANSEPWLLATSLQGGVEISRKVINIYKTRMQIEQNFRDIKSHQYGFGLRYSRTENIDRLEILLLIGFIATIVLWFLGAIAEKHKLQYSFQANSCKNKRILSLLSLGLQIIKHGVFRQVKFDIKDGYNIIQAYNLEIVC